MKTRLLTLYALLISTAAAYAQQQENTPEWYAREMARIDSIVASMDTMSVTLGEATVKAMRPVTTLKNGAIVTRIEGSVYEKVGSARDVLSKVPGILKEGDDLKVIGRGEPEFYINGRRVRDKEELKRLTSDMIKEVEVITNPGAAYDINTTAVVRIRTKRQQGEGLSLAINAKDEQSLCFGVNDPEVQVHANYRFRNVDIFAEIKEWKWDSAQRSDIWGFSTLPGDKTFLQDGIVKVDWVAVGTHSNVGFDWQPADNHSLGAKVDYAVRTKTHEDELMKECIYDTGVLTDDITSKSTMTSKNPYSITGNAYYNGTIGKLNIDANVDFYMDKDNKTQNTKEQSPLQGYDDLITPTTHTENTLYAGKLVFTYPVWKGQVQVGTEESFVRRSDKYTINYNPSDWCTDTHTNDDTYAAFAQYNATLANAWGQGKWAQFGVGIRYEHSNFEFNDKLQGTNTSRSYNDVFPSANFATQIGQVQVMTSYTYKTMRPSFYMLDDTKNYNSRYAVQQGNPLLKPFYIQNVDLTARWKWVTGNVQFTHIKNEVMPWSEPYGNDGSILISHKNLQKPTNRFVTYFAFTPSWGVYSPNWSFGFVKQWLTLDFDNGPAKFNKPMWIFNANNAFRFKHAWQLELNSYYRSKNHNGTVETTRHYWQAEAAIQKSFLKNEALTLRLAWQDIFCKSRQDIFINYGSYQIRQNNHLDYDRLIFTISYRLNATHSKYRGTGAGDAARSRIGSGSGK